MYILFDILSQWNRCLNHTPNRLAQQGIRWYWKHYLSSLKSHSMQTDSCLSWINIEFFLCRIPCIRDLNQPSPAVSVPRVAGRSRAYIINKHGQAPVPLSIFRSNSKFDENSKHSSVQYTRPITTIFCTRHDSVTVVTCAKYRCDRSSIFETRAFWIFIEFRIRSKYA